MKTFGMLPVAMVVMSGWISCYGQAIESEVPGDNFSLEGALELFKKSESPEEFEKLLNSPDSKVNNLDLNGDGYIDYVRVFDRNEGNVHAFIIQAVVSEKESQDIAVIELEKLGNGKAVLQIIGDEDVYGVTTIIEPTQEVRTFAGATTTRTVVNVWAWPSVQYVYHPYYAGWHSPWGWHHHPRWYHRWRPVAYVHYYSIWSPYHPYYSICNTRRIVYAHHIYHPYRSTSVVVHNRYHAKLTRYRSSHNDRYGHRRTREDDRRSYVSNERSSRGTANERGRNDLYSNRSSVTPAQETRSQNPSISRDRNIPSDMRRNPSTIKREDTSNRRPANVPDNIGIHPGTTSPSLEKGRSTDGRSSYGQQRSTLGDRNAPVQMQRNTTTERREETSNRRPVAVPNTYREVRLPPTSQNLNRSPSPESNHVQQRSVMRERSAPATIERNSGPSENRSGSVQRDYGSRHQAPGPSFNTSRSSGSSGHVQQRSSGRSSDATRSVQSSRRGRQ